MSDRIDALGFTVTCTGGEYGLVVWARMGEVQHHTESRTYDRLLFDELVDTMLAELADGRPGTRVGDGWSLPTLWD